MLATACGTLCLLALVLGAVDWLDDDVAFAVAAVSFTLLLAAGGM